MATLVRPKIFTTRTTPLRGAWGQAARPEPYTVGVMPTMGGIMPLGVDIIDDAPEDGYTYGRRNGEWTRVVPLSGAEMTGALFLHDDPVEPLQAATKRYFDKLWERIDGGRV